MIPGEMNLWRRDYGRFRRKLRPFVAHDYRRGRYLLKCHLRRMAFRRRKWISITTATTATDNLLRYRQSVTIWRRRNESHRLVCCTLGDLMTHENTAQQQSDNREVHDYRNG